MQSLYHPSYDGLINETASNAKPKILSLYTLDNNESISVPLGLDFMPPSGFRISG